MPIGILLDHAELSYLSGGWGTGTLQPGPYYVWREEKKEERIVWGGKKYRTEQSLLKCPWILNTDGIDAEWERARWIYRIWKTTGLVDDSSPASQPFLPCCWKGFCDGQSRSLLCVLLWLIRLLMLSHSMDSSSQIDSQIWHTYVNSFWVLVQILALKLLPMFCMLLGVCVKVPVYTCVPASFSACWMLIRYYSKIIFWSFRLFCVLHFSI